MVSSPYRDVSHLVTHCVKGRDFDIYIVDRDSQITVTAVHGGRIEALVSEVAAEVAGESYNLYDFRGIRPSGNEELRVPIARFAEMRVNALMRRSYTALLIDGVPGEAPLVHLGGKNRGLRNQLEAALTAAQFVVSGPQGPGAAHDPHRFYNAPEAGGVQLELSLALRRLMIEGPLEPARWPETYVHTERYHTLTQVVRDTLDRYLAEVKSDLGRAMEQFERDTERFPPSLRRAAPHHGEEE